MNTFGILFRLTDFGESHGPAMGGIVDGMPAGIHIDLDAVQREVDLRRPGTSKLVTARDEADRVEFLSGLTSDGITLGTPIGFIIRNTDHHSNDYAEMEGKFRPNHADYTWMQKYGVIDWRGGGRASARQTVCRVVAGALASQLIATHGVSVSVKLDDGVTPDAIEQARAAGDSIGGIVECRIIGVPPGLGEPVYGKLQARLADAMLSINAVKGFEYGDGFASAHSRGSEQADIFTKSPDDAIVTATNHSGGIQGGISNGMEITMRVAFKPTPTIMQPLKTVDVDGNEVELRCRGRHDPCVAVRGMHVVKAMAALVIADALLLARTQQH